MPRVAKKASSAKSALPLEPLVDQIATIPPPLDKHGPGDVGEPRTPAHSPTRPHIGVVEADLADILHEAWAAIVPETDPQAAEIVDHDVVAAQVIDAADAQDVAALEAAFRLVQSTYDDQTLGDISDRVLIYTVQKGWSGACKLCVKYNADVNAQDDDNGGSPLMYAIHNSHDHIVDELLRLGAGMDHFEQQGYTPLMVACLSDNAAACERLLQSNTALDQTDSKGRTALSMACRYGSLECVKVLTTAGANVGHRDEDGMTVLEHAEQNDRRQVVTLIKRAQLASQMRQRRKAKNAHKDCGLTSDEYERRELEAQARADELLAELHKEEEGAEAKKAKQKAKRTAKKVEKKTKRKDDSPEADGCTAGKQGAQKAAAADAAHKNGGGGANGKAAQNGAAGGGGGDALDRFGCDVQEAAELGSYQRVMLEGRMSPDEAVWQWCADGGEIDPDKLRKMWEFLGDAASQCSDRQQQPMYLNMLTVLLEICTGHGVTVKQGRKVKQRLEKVGPLRDELEQATRPPLSRERLDAALAGVRGVVGLIEPSVVAHAHAVAARVAEVGEAAATVEMQQAETESEESEEEAPVAAAPPPTRPPAHRAAPRHAPLGGVAARAPPPGLPAQGAPRPPAGAGAPPRMPAAAATPRPAPRAPVAGMRPPARSVAPVPDAMSRQAFPPLSAVAAKDPPAPPPPPQQPAAPPPHEHPSHLLGSALVDALDGPPSAHASAARAPHEFGDRGAQHTRTWPTGAAPTHSPPPDRATPPPRPALHAPPPASQPRQSLPPFGGMAERGYAVPTASGPAPPRPRPPPPAPAPAPHLGRGVAPVHPQRNGLGGFYHPTPPPRQREDAPPPGAFARPAAPMRGSGDVPGDAQRRAHADFDLRSLRLNTTAEPFTPAAAKGAPRPTGSGALPILPPGRYSHLATKSAGNNSLSNSDPLVPASLGPDILPSDPFRMNSPPRHHYGAGGLLAPPRHALPINGTAPRGGLGIAPRGPPTPVKPAVASPQGGAGMDERFGEELLGGLLDEE